METLVSLLFIFGTLILGYLFGSFSTAVFVGKVFFHQDPRLYGSKNAGGTNAGRLWGKRFGFLIIVIDMLKTIAPIFICWAVFSFAIPHEYFWHLDLLTNGEIINRPIQLYYIAPIAVLVGHSYPLFANFKGGKGVAQFMGTLFSVSWFIGWMVGGLYFLLLKITKYVSLTSILGAVFGTILAWLFMIPQIQSLTFFMNVSMEGGMIAGVEFATTVTIISAFLIYRHHSNISRLRNHTEPKIKWMGGQKKAPAVPAGAAATPANTEVKGESLDAANYQEPNKS